MVKHLEAARATWLSYAKSPGERRERGDSTFLVDRDEADRVLDFHAFRHTFITNLVRGGIHPKLAQRLARHSTITQTMDRYSHTLLGELSDALSVLPDLEPEPSTDIAAEGDWDAGRPPWGYRHIRTKRGRSDAAGSSGQF